ncbi:TPA: hypothetical protein ACH3X3_003975 [Trebouxia sp. C0006]
MYKKPLQALRNASTKVAFQRQGKRTGDPRRLVPDCTVSKPWSRQLARSPHFCRYQVSMMSDRMLVTDIRQTISKINTTTRHISSIADLKRLAAHDEVKVFWMKGQGIMARVDWQAQHDALSGISRLTYIYSQTRFNSFLERLPDLIKRAKQAKRNAERAAQSLGQAAAQLGDLSHKVGESANQLNAQAQQLAQWEAGDRKHQGGLEMAGHVLGPLTLGFGYLLWLGSNDFKRKADNNSALFFGGLVNKLEHMLIMGAEATQAPGSQMHLHFEDMGQVMVELRNAVDDMSVRARHENRHIQNNN